MIQNEGPHFFVDVKGTLKTNKPLVKDDAMVKMELFPYWVFQLA